VQHGCLYNFTGLTQAATKCLFSAGQRPNVLIELVTSLLLVP